MTSGSKSGTTRLNIDNAMLDAMLIAARPQAKVQTSTLPLGTAALLG
jgi:hypothetical protein